MGDVTNSGQGTSEWAAALSVRQLHRLFSVPRSLCVHLSAAVANVHCFHLPLDLSAAPGLFLFFWICLFHNSVVFITVSFFNLSLKFTPLICLITDVTIYSFFNPIRPCPHRDLGWKGWCFLTSFTPSPSSQPQPLLLLPSLVTVLFSLLLLSEYKDSREDPLFSTIH